VPKSVRGGADTLVAGSSVFGAPDPAEAVRHLTRIAEEAQRS
jgi:pentose-5-phosphate-3-epimerase